nr:MAG TPA: hypothetical protein [Caudoviricetes sp.]
MSFLYMYPGFISLAKCSFKNILASVLLYP